MIVNFARCTQKNLRNTAVETGTAQLLTIPYSHYCEFARWTLVANNVPFKEHGYSPGAHVLPALALRLGGSEKYLAESSKLKPVGQKAKRIHPTAVPAVILPTGMVLPDSWKVAETIFSPDRVKNIDGLKHFLDYHLGSLTRQFVYIALLAPQNSNVWTKLCCQDAGCLYNVLWHLGLGWWLTKRMRNTFQTDNEVEKGKCAKELLEAFDAIDERWLADLEDEEYLGGTTPCMEDYALASMCAPVLFPPLYCDGLYNQHFDKLLDQDKTLSAMVDTLRKTKSGKHTLRMYSIHRNAKSF